MAEPAWIRASDAGCVASVPRSSMAFSKSAPGALQNLPRRICHGTRWHFQTEPQRTTPLPHARPAPLARATATRTALRRARRSGTVGATVRRRPGAPALRSGIPTHRRRALLAQLPLDRLRVQDELLDQLARAIIRDLHRRRF